MYVQNLEPMGKSLFDSRFRANIQAHIPGTSISRYNPPEQSIIKGKDMTIAIAAIAGDNIVGVADRLVTNGIMTVESRLPKIFKWPDKRFGMIAGDDTLSRYTFYAMQKEIEQDDLVDLYIKCCDKQIKEIVRRNVLARFDLTVDTLKELAKEGNYLGQYLTPQVENFCIEPVSAIFANAGHTKSLSQINYWNNKRHTVRDQTTIGCTTIGVADNCALNEMMKLGYSPNDTLAEVVFKAYMAKKSVENFPSIGSLTDIIVATPDGCEFLPEGAINSLDECYQHYQKKQKENFEYTSEEASNVLSVYLP